MKAYIIDPEARSISEVDWDEGYKSIYTRLGCELFDCVEIDPVTMDSVYVDDEGLFKNPTRFFQISGPHFISSPLAGKGLVLGYDVNTGESEAPKLSLEAVEALVTWVALEDIPAFEPL